MQWTSAYSESVHDWRDGAVGKQILVTEHSGANNDEPFTICGVYDDIRIGTIQEEDERPSILFYSSDPKESNYLLLKFHHMTPEAMTRARETLPLTGEWRQPLAFGRFRSW